MANQQLTLEIKEEKKKEKNKNRKVTAEQLIRSVKMPAVSCSLLLGNIKACS